MAGRGDRGPGKGRHQERLPLPVDVGQALVATCGGQRPATAARAVFICAYAPLRALSASGVSEVARAAGERAGLPEATRAHTGCGTPRPPRCCAPVRDCPRSRRCCGTAARRPQRCTPRSTTPRSRRWCCRGRPVRDEHHRTSAGTGTVDLAGTATSICGCAARSATSWCARASSSSTSSGTCRRRARTTSRSRTRWLGDTADPRDPVWWSARLGVVRGFARYLPAIDPATGDPPVGLLPDRARRVTPYIYTDDDLDRPCSPRPGSCRRRGRAATYQTLIGLLAVTGMRVGEAIGLDRRDLDSEHGRAHRPAGQVRQVPAATAAPERRRPRWATTPIGVASAVPPPHGRGVRLRHRRPADRATTVSADLPACWARPGIARRARRRPPGCTTCAHVRGRTLLGWYRDGEDVQPGCRCCRPTSATATRGHTYWYLSAAPELLRHWPARRRQRRHLAGAAAMTASPPPCRRSSPTGSPANARPARTPSPPTATRCGCC